jgi:hypothetical protein
MHSETLRWKRIAFVLLVTLASCNTAAKQRAAKDKAQADQAAEAEQAKQEAARADEFRRRDEEAAARRALQYPDAQTAENPLFEGRRNILAKLAANPRAVQPKAILPPTADERWTTYEHEIDGIGTVTQWRTSNVDWSISMSGYRAPPEMFAPAGGLRHLVDVGPVSWWRVTAGPFDHDFVMKNDGVVVVDSMRHVCNGEGGMPALTTECNRY